MTPGRERIVETARILAVDDDPSSLSLATAILARQYELRTATSGAEAIEVATAFRPDLVLLDVVMPDMDGLETCRRLRSDTGLTDAKVVLVSAQSHVDDRIRGYDAGADDYVAKPYVPRELLAKVQVLLRLKRTEELSRLKESILLLLAHETRTPLTIIHGAVDALRSTRPMDDSQIREFTEMIADAAARLDQLTERSHLLWSLQSGQVSPTIGRVDMSPFIASVIAGAEPAARDSGVLIRTDCEYGLHAFIDAHLMGLAVSAILDNAVRFSPAGATVFLALRTDDSALSISVADGGPGISAELRSRLFEGFHVHDLAHHSRGVGLGLPISREIARIHGGTIKVESSARGSTVSITLPGMVLGPTVEDLPDLGRQRV